MDMRVLMGGTEPRGSGVRSYYFLNRLREFSVFLNLSEVFLCSDLLEALILPGPVRFHLKHWEICFLRFEESTTRTALLDMIYFMSPKSLMYKIPVTLNFLRFVWDP